MVKMSFLRTRKKIKRRQHNRAAFTGKDLTLKAAREDKGVESQIQEDRKPAGASLEQKTRVERDREALSRCGAGAAGGSLG